MKFSVFIRMKLNPSSAKPTKWSNTLKQFVGNFQIKFFNICGMYRNWVPLTSLQKVINTFEGVLFLVTLQANSLQLY